MTDKVKGQAVATAPLHPGRKGLLSGCRVVVALNEIPILQNSRRNLTHLVAERQLCG